MRAAVIAAIALATSIGCTVSPPPAVPDDADAFITASKKLSEIRASASAARTESLALQLEAPYMPSAITARGSVGVKPPGSLRMILVGPGGTTAMDLWMKDGRFRFDIPALGRVIRGEPSARPETRKGLPVEFLRWWMFQPLGGRLLAARRSGKDLEVLLDEPGRVTVALLAPDGSIRAHRRWLAPGEGGRYVAYEEEWLEATGVGCAKAKYRQKSTSLTVTATCQSTRPTVNEAAFEEPEDKGLRP